MTTSPRIEISGLTKIFGDNTMLRNIKLDNARGGSVVLIGYSGASNPLILKCVMGLIRPNGSVIRFQGQDTAAFSDRQRKRFLDHFGITFKCSGFSVVCPCGRKVPSKFCKKEKD